jgi:hypothetical protein
MSRVLLRQRELIPEDLRSCAGQFRLYPSLRTARKFWDESMETLKGNRAIGYSDGSIQHVPFSMNHEGVILWYAPTLPASIDQPYSFVSVARLRGADRVRCLGGDYRFENVVRNLPRMFTKDVAFAIIDEKPFKF